MSVDVNILRMLKDRAEYRKVVGRIPESALNKETKAILDDYTKYFQQFPDHERIDMDVFIPLFRTWHATLSDDKRSVYELVLESARADVPEDVKHNLMRTILELRLATDIAQLLTKFDAGDLPNINSELRRVQDEFKADSSVRDSTYIDDDIHDLLSADDNNDGLRWRLSCLNESTRPLRPGDFGIIAGRPDRGKTTFISSEITAMASQLPTDRNILWLNNEGLGKRIIPRIYQSALGATRGQLLTLMHAGQLKPTYQKLMGRMDRIRVVDIHGMDNFSVEQIIEANSAGLVIYDMIDNIRGFGQESRTDRQLEQMYQWGRETAVRLEHVGMATSQISADGDNMQFPAMQMLKDSKCLAPGTMIRMFDGSARAVETIKHGETVMGPDSLPRVVTGPVTGQQDMYRVEFGDKYFVCNSTHIITAIKSTSKPMNGHAKGDIVDLPIEFFVKNPSRLEHYKAVNARIEYPEAILPMDPYLFGLWLGDGAQRECRITTGDDVVLAYLEALPTYRSTYKQESNCSDVYFGPRSWLDTMGVRNNKHIPAEYKTSSIEQRKALLAGIMDSDGTIDCGTSVVSMSNKRKKLLMDIREVARSLGYNTFTRAKASTNSVSVGFSCTDELPCLLERKVYKCEEQYRKMTITALGLGDYAGFTVSGDGRYVSADYTVLHNTGKQGACDFILMIGSLDDPGYNGVRWISLPKSKLRRDGAPGDPRAAVKFDASRARYEDLPIAAEGSV